MKAKNYISVVLLAGFYRLAFTNDSNELESKLANLRVGESLTVGGYTFELVGLAGSLVRVSSIIGGKMVSVLVPEFELYSRINKARKLKEK